MVKAVVAAMLVVAMLAGCTDDGSNAEAEVIPLAFDEVVVTASTGAIRGIVISESIVPIGGVTITLAGSDLTRVTNDEGAFVFNGLEAGTHFLSASKPGYFPVQASTEVVAGVAEPPIVKMQMVVDAESQPFTELLTWSGFFGCGLGTNAGGGVGVNPCAVDAILCEFTGTCLINTANTYDFPFGASRIPDFAQAEMVWVGNQPLGNDLNLGWHDEGTADFKGISGPSPLVLPASQEEILDAHDEDITSLLVRVFPGGTQEMTLTVQQRFDVYVTYFYGFTPREGWAFVNDGSCTSPEECA